MDGLGEEVASVDVADGGPRLHGKEREGSLKLAESSKMLESGEMAIPVESSFPESSFYLLADIMEGKNLNRGVSPSDMAEQPSPSPHYMDDGGNVIEELMVRNYDGSNLAIVGTSNNREKMQPRQGQWQHLYQIGGGSGTGHSRGNTLHRDNGQAIQDSRYSSSTDILVQKRSRNDRSEGTEELVNAEPKGVLSNTGSHASIRTKILSKSGFSEFFVKDSLKGKGIIFRGPTHDGMRPEGRDQNNGKAVDGEAVAGNDSVNMSGKAIVPGSRFSSLDCDGASLRDWPGAGQPGGSNHDGLNLREWINSGRLKVSKFDCLNIFRQIVELVDCSHSQGDAMHDLRPSSFILLPSNQVKYLGSAVQREMPECTVDQGIPYSGSCVIRRRQPEQAMLAPIGVFPKKQKFGENINHIQHWPQFTAKYALKNGSANDVDGNRSNTQSSRNKADEHNLNAKHGIQGKFTGCHLAIAGQQQFTSLNECLEEKWYSSPEELSEGICTKSSNIYSLGVLLFELLGHFNNERAHGVAMSDLRHRILPSHFLSESPKEAGFCLWLLHPEPTSRPTTREILQSELINGLQGVSAEELSSSLDQDDTESELLLYFLVSLKEHKQQQASKLVEDVRCIDSDIEEIEKRNYSRKPFVHDCQETNFLNCLNSREDTFVHKEPSSSELLSQLSPSSKINETRLMKNISQLENAYFSTRSKIQLTESDASTRQDKELLRNRDNWHSEEDEEQQSSTDYRGSFFDGLCKYARYSKFEVRGLLRTGDFNNSANVICSLSFDRDGYYFAAAGVSKKIKIFEFSSLFNDMDIHYPVVEMVNGSKLSCVCWNSYIKNYLASTGYDGGVKLWDASTGQGIFQFHEHEKRAWSADFSQVYPTKLASGSDDCSVKLWNINERKSLGTIRNIANVCCVQFSPYSTHLLAFGSADYRTYCYDLRNVRTPWCILAGHEKAVSYVKFLDPETLVTASTDNSLKIWDLNKTTFSGSSSTACSLTLGGHTNEKNFVGLSVANGYIACGSESNEVFSYYKSLPMPITSHKFGSIDPISGKETDDDNGQFVSSVCWRGKSDMIVAANSSGCIKVLQMV